MSLFDIFGSKKKKEKQRLQQRIDSASTPSEWFSVGVELHCAKRNEEALEMFFESGGTGAHFRST